MIRIRTVPVMLFAAVFLPFCLAAQDDATLYSNPAAPVGDTAYTVPSSVKPLFETWMRDTYVTLGPDGYYYMTGTTVSPDRKFAGGFVHSWDYNDGIYLWRSKDLKDWQGLGLVWSFANDATWQKKGVPVAAGAHGPNGEPLDSFYRAIWAPELHYIKSKKQWLMVACLSGKVGSFILKSTSGKPEGPYVNIEGNADGPLFSVKDVAGILVPGSTETGKYSGIDGTLFEDDNGDVYFVGKDHYIAKMKADLSALAEPFKRFAEKPYNPEPYIEGVYLTKHGGKYQLLQTVWSVRQPDGSFSYIENKEKGKAFHSYDVVVAEADNIYGPYGLRYAAILEGGHNNLFVDKKGAWWSTVFFNPRGECGKLYPATCRPAIVAVKWKGGKLMPDSKRTNDFYASFTAKETRNAASVSITKTPANQN